ncbi:MAG: hypothetical protein K2O44_01125 [Clostridia bacterium]|nr:hypothetical protein [Clostridia bacterium]
MTFDIIVISEEEAEKLEPVRLKLLRTAQQKKNELEHKLQAELAEQKRLTYANGVENSTIYSRVSRALTAEYEYQVEILREQLIFNMSLREPTNPDETGGSGSDNSAYLVDYELSYLERYIAVRDYYMTIEDPNERLALLRADKVAQDYLGTYYNLLFDYLYTFTK